MTAGQLRAPAGMTLAEIVITAVAAVIVFVAMLVLVLELARRRDRRRSREWGAEPGSFGSDDEAAHPGAPGYGRPAGYGPPPLWTDARHDPRSEWR